MAGIHQLRWELGVALLIKIILITGLWFLIFRWSEKPAVKPDVAQLFAPAQQQTIEPSHFSLPETQESHNVR